MATSGSTNFAITRDNLIADILEELLVIPSGGTPTANQISSVARRLNYLVKGWANYGIQIYGQATTSKLLTSGTASYTVGESGADITMARPIMVTAPCYLRDSDGYDTPIIVLTRDEYHRISDKDVAGTPTRIFYDAQSPLGTLYVWPVPNDSTHTLFFTYQRPLEDFDATGDSPDIPQEFLYALFRWGVVECAQMFGKKPPANATELAQAALERAIGSHRELKQPLMGWPLDGH